MVVVMAVAVAAVGTTAKIEVDTVCDIFIASSVSNARDDRGDAGYPMHTRTLQIGMPRTWFEIDCVRVGSRCVPGQHRMREPKSGT